MTIIAEAMFIAANIFEFLASARESMEDRSSSPLLLFFGLMAVQIIGTKLLIHAFPVLEKHESKLLVIGEVATGVATFLLL